MVKETIQIAGAVDAQYSITQKYIGEIQDSCEIRELEIAARILRSDIALELRGDRLQLFSVKVRGLDNT